MLELDKNYMTTEILILLISVIINFLLAILVLLHSFYSRSAKYFILMILGIIGWTISNYFSNFSTDYQTVLWLNKIIFIATAVFGWSFLIFTEVFPKDNQPNKKIFWIFSLLALIVIIISLTPYLVEDIIIKDDFSEISFGWGIWLYSVFLLSCIILGFVIILKKYFISKDFSVKKAIRILLFGFGLFLFFGLLTNLLLPILFGRFEFTNLAPLYIIFLSLAIAWSILKHRFLNVKVIATELLTFLVWIFLLIRIFLAESWQERMINIGLLIFIVVAGIFLIKSVLLEVKRREEIQKLYKEVDRLSQAKSEFISIASHQLRTPLAIIKGYLSMILEGTYGKLGERVEKSMKNSYKSNERLIKLVNDLLSLSRLDAGKIKFEPKPVFLKEIIESIIDELKIEMEKKELYVKIKEEFSPLPKVTVDQDHIRQVFFNIIDNAIKYTQKGGITIEFSRVGNMANIKIFDTGEGMDEKELKSLFQMFSRATAGTQLHTEGIGIGLYIAKRFIDMHNGRIWAESEGKGKGSVFYVELPF